VPTLAPVESPNDTPLELENVIADRFADAAPAEALMADIRPTVDGTVYDAVIAWPALEPNETPFALENEIAPDV
jgi:hypothetical protein